MPGTTTRLNRVRSSAGSLRPAGRTARPAHIVLRDKHVALMGADVSAHVTGFAGFTESLGDLPAERTARLSRPLAAGHAGPGGPTGGSPGFAETVGAAESCAAPDLADAIDVLAGAPQARAVMAAGARHCTRDFLGPGTAAATLEAIAARTLSRPAGSSCWGRNR